MVVVESNRYSERYGGFAVVGIGGLKERCGGGGGWNQGN